MTKVSFCVIMFAMMAAEYLNAQSFYHVYVEPNKAEREVIPIEPGPLTAELILQPKDYSWKIRNSGIVAPDDDFLWSGPHGYMPGTQPTPYMHMYLLLNGHSSREYVKIEGNLMKPGNGVGNSPWFRVTVPDVDIDWDGYEDKEDEEEEDARKVYCPVENDISKCKKLILRNPLDSGNIRDDSSLLALYKNVVLSWTPAAAFQVKDSSGNAYSNGGSISLTTSLTWPLELYVVPVSGQPLSDIVITLEGPAGADGTRAKDRIIGSTLGMDLDAMKVNNNLANGELSDDDEETVGAFLPLNKDDDNYDSVEDYSSGGSVTGESDLLPIKIHKVDPQLTLAKCTLTFPAGLIKIWQYSDRTGAVTGSTELDTNQDKTLYVEGLSLGSGQIKINLKYGGSTIEDCDRIKVTVFDWTGPHNVPDYSIHQYVASGALSSSKWITPSGGSFKTGSGTSDVTILWGSGPVNGKAIYEVNSNYKWGLEINVVEVKIEAPVDSDSFKVGNPVFEGVQDIWPNTSAVVYSSGTPVDQGLLWKAKVTLNGPSLNNTDQRGVTHIEVGFVQNLTFTSCTGNYTINGSACTLTANIQNNTYHDVKYGVSPSSVYYSLGDAIHKPATINDRVKTIMAVDSPESCAPKFFKKGITLNNPDDDIIDSIQWTETFKLWVTARTDEPLCAADQIFTCRAIANWSYINNESYPPPDPLIGSTVNAPSAWTSVTDGSEPLIKDGPTANDILRYYFSY